jgi:5-methylcytosine-specific restriction endonuclease McrA
VKRTPLQRRTPLRAIKAKATRPARATRSSPIPPDVAAQVRARDGGCVGRRVFGIPTAACVGGLHLHHIRRRSQGGQHVAGNLVMLCASCHGWVHEHPRDAAMLGLLETPAKYVITTTGGTR